jgi:hypothetical protein
VAPRPACERRSSEAHGGASAGTVSRRRGTDRGVPDADRTERTGTTLGGRAGCFAMILFSVLASVMLTVVANLLLR